EILELIICTFTVRDLFSDPHPQPIAGFGASRDPRSEITNYSFAFAETMVVHDGWLAFHAHRFRHMQFFCPCAMAVRMLGHKFEVDAMASESFTFLL
ncbi:hypothetical protein, partial [Salmonella sp. s54925]|uniref:hypothetical protein n=1 Tax=Salmonella sp. s54925 TaxID=3159674 RepID=UPI00397EBB32